MDYLLPFFPYWFQAALITVITAAAEEMNGILGHSVILPCTYSIQIYRKCNMCWGLGGCPLSSCDAMLIKTNGTHVSYSKSKRFKLNGNVAEGDVSLTIENVTEADGMKYCCRIEIPGLINDLKKQWLLLLTEVTTTSFPSLETTTAVEIKEFTHIKDNQTVTTFLASTVLDGTTTKEEGRKDKRLIISGSLAAILFAILSLILFIFRRKYHFLNVKMQKHKNKLMYKSFCIATCTVLHIKDSG
ncbi:hepatitis A virus cellular receptor 1 homolog [Protopterus annectens]|uniref:hepatitis A virus cellular receptor 1 homolog n=1 Tax=Protopterus annectens TaxID=7888 RepID=UPI001CFC2238|nr:hepatitis A virus cellular receptor 1 homolog [Protopterus annectens]